MKKKRDFNAIAAAVLVFSLFFTCCKSVSEPEHDFPKPFNDLSAVELAANIKVGWNLGNTLDASDLTWLGGMPMVSSMETAWGNPVASKANFTAIKRNGFNAIRIPVSWAKCADKNYNIRKDWMKRVKQVVDYAVDNDMYIILNTHHDEGIFKFLNKDMEESKKALQRIWTQIAENFKNYDEKLIFEGLNEPRTKGSAAEWNGGTIEERNNVNILNQLFVNTVRASGGNNEKRILMVPTYAASATAVAMNDLVIPADDANEKNKIIISIHAYEPYDFAMNGNSAVNTWSKYNPMDTSPITERINRAYDLFIKIGIPVIMGEFGAIDRKNEEARAEWAEYYVSYAKSKGVKCFWWDDGGNFKLFNRGNNTFYFPKIAASLTRGAD
ncbi:MAG: glycoside hydrolase family 5 protein [Treponema sp.]|nr:glycoside hydrolase family 5 protein [Treponema sp.]